MSVMDSHAVFGKKEYTPVTVNAKSKATSINSNMYSSIYKHPSAITLQ